jgi:hypothetical protein
MESRARIQSPQSDRISPCSPLRCHWPTKKESFTPYCKIFMHQFSYMGLFYSSFFCCIEQSLNPTTDRRNKQNNCIHRFSECERFRSMMAVVSPAMAAQCIAGRGYNLLIVIANRHALHYAAADRLHTEEHITILFSSSLWVLINSAGGG